MRYIYKLRKDKRGLYIKFSKKFVKRFKIKTNTVIKLLPFNKRKFVMQIGRNEFLCEVG